MGAWHWGPLQGGQSCKGFVELLGRWHAACLGKPAAETMALQLWAPFVRGHRTVCAPGAICLNGTADHLVL